MPHEDYELTAERYSQTEGGEAWPRIIGFHILHLSHKRSYTWMRGDAVGVAAAGADQS
jgi:hypothetical protein